MPNPLSDQELKILSLISQGKPAKEICQTFRVNIRSVQNWTRAIYQKLGARNAPQAVAIALANDLIPNPYVVKKEAA